MLPELSEIKFRRKQLNLTQIQLAELSGVSQSLIAKIESGGVVPSFENAKKLFDCLERVSQTHQITVGQLMRTPVLTVLTTDSVQKAVRIMQKNGFSQLAVLQKDRIIGTVSEKGILARLGKNLENKSLADSRVSDFLEESLPQIQSDTPVRIVSSLLEHAPAVLVVLDGKIRGIVSKSDLLKSAIDKKITKHHRLV